MYNRSRSRLRDGGGWNFIVVLHHDLWTIFLEDALDTLANRADSRTDTRHNALADTNRCDSYLGHGATSAAKRRRGLARLHNYLRRKDEAKPDGCLVAQLGVLKLDHLLNSDEGLQLC